jgi:signal transduction histidine kinase/CheY-like chemotaxis protein
MNPRQYTILIVDDCGEDREVYRRYLSREAIFNYQMIEAESGEDAIKQMAKIQPDLILLDYLLPDLTGLELIEQLNEIAQIPLIIMLTGEGNEKIAVKAMKSGVKDYLVKKSLTPETLTTAVKNALQQDYLQSLLTKRIRQQQLISETALRIRQSLDISEILTIAVREVKLLLNCDRVVIYRFASDMTGDIVAESVKSSWKPSLGLKLIDTCFQGQVATGKYERGETWAIDDIHNSKLSPCHIELLEEFQVKSNAVVPILLRPSISPAKSCLWGLLIAHQCSHIRHWEADEIELLDRLSVQLAIAIQQAESLDNLKKELETRKKLELELARLVNILAASEDCIALFTSEYQIIWQNPRMREITKDNANLSLTECYSTQALSLIQQEGIPKAIAKGSWLGETELVGRDERKIPVSQLILAHKSSTGEVEYLSTVMRDLTERKQAEQSLRARTRELEWLNQELVKLTSLLKKRNQELDNFAYVTSHDLKAPLRAIANLATWLSEDLAGQIPEENQEQLELMRSRVKRMDGLIQGLLEYSRVGRKHGRIKVVNVKELLEEVIDSLSPPPEFTIKIASDLPTLETEVILLEQVFSNSISNALKHHHGKQGKIVISVADLGDCYEFAIADDGPGIAPQYHERIFDIFQTLQPRDSLESTGIGLSIVKKIVEDRGGKVRVESQLGDGTTFYFTWKK